VTINEAIEISKKYSTLESASFINGILDKISKEHTAP
jgi:N utilization substance protein B